MQSPRRKHGIAEIPIAAADVKRTVTELLRNFSIEVTPKEGQAIDDFRTSLEPHSRVYITWLPGGDYSATIHAATKLAAQGMIPVPHIAARSIRNLDHLNEVVGRLADSAGVSEVLVVGGCHDEPLGDFHESMQLIEAGILERHGIRRIYIGGHPEGSPEIGATNLDSALDRKNKWRTQGATSIQIVTQFCFNSAAIIDWEDRVRMRGTTLPIRIGLPGLSTITALMKNAHTCGVVASRNALMRHYRNVLKMATIWSPDKIVLELATRLSGGDPSLFKACHFFPFGGFERTASWARALARGKFLINDRGIEVTDEVTDR